MDEAAGGVATNDGVIAIWPPTLTGSYTVHYIPEFVDITNTSDGFLLEPDWMEWLLCKAALPILQRDNNKKASLDLVMARLNRAEGKIVAHARRQKRGNIVGRRRDGLEL
jgi:hypothetical protein